MAKSKSRKKDLNPISLAFLDVMSCGFGAVVLIFLILDHSSSDQNQVTTPEEAAEINLLEEDIQEGQEGLARLRNTISEVDFRIVEAQGRARRIQEEVDTIMEEIAQMENETLAQEESVENLRSEIENLEEELKRLRAEQEETGENIRRFIGEGNRQYLTGLLMGGNRILILVDMSASMLDDTIVNVIRRRNMSESAKLQSGKWVRTRKTVDWLTAQLPPPSRYQIYLFNNETRALLPGTEGQWLEVADKERLDESVERLNTIVPSEGTNLEQVFVALQQLNPLPDNVFLITDGLPTLGSGAPGGNTISGRERERVFERALRQLPSGIPVNTIMLPLEGDPMASSAYWRLATVTGGTLLNPAPDWP